MRFPLAALTLFLCLPSPASAQQEKPLPDRTNFLIEFQVKRRGITKLFSNSDDPRLLSQYTYKETVSEMSLDSKGNTKKTQSDVFERIPTRVPGYIYRRQIVKNSIPLTQKDLDKQDKQNEADVTKREANDLKLSATRAKRRDEDLRKFEAGLAKDLDKRGLTGDERRAEEERAKKTYLDIRSGANRLPPKMEDSWILMATDFQLVRREVLEGISTILMTFKPNPKYKSGGDMDEKILQHTVGRVWVSEDDYQLARMEVEVTAQINFGMGLLAKVQPGSKGVFEWRKVNNEVWLPLREDFTAKVRILLLKGEHSREVHEYSDYKKYSVQTQIKRVE